MNYKIFLGCLLSLVISMTVAAQDTLPKFNATIRGQHIVISWQNPYGESIRQLSIQRSYDSLKNFKSIMTIPDPTNLQNGYLDSKAPDTRQFYRIFILLEGGNYFFSKSKQAIIDTSKVAIDVPGVPKDSVIAPVNNAFRPSQFVFTDRNGIVKIALPDAATKKYSIRFYEEDNTPVFEIKHIPDSVIMIDKGNFTHAGWYNFELYDGNTLKEKYKFYISKDF